MAGYRSFLDIPSEIYEEAKSKGIDISSLALSGRSPDEAVSIVKGTPAPDNPLLALPKGIARGAIGLTGGIVRGIGELTGSEALKSVGSGISEFAEKELGLSPTSGTFTKVLGTVGEVIGLPIPGGVLAKGASLAGKLLKAERAIEGIGKTATKVAIPTTFGLAGYGTAREMQEKYVPEMYESTEGQVRAGLTGLAHAGLSLVPFAEKFKFLRKLPVVGDSHLVYSAVSEAIAFPIVAGLFDLSSRFGAGVYADPTFTGELSKILGGLVEDTTKSDVVAMMLAGGILGALRGRFITKHQDRLRELVTPEGLKEEARVEDIGVKEKLGEGEEVKGKLGGGKEAKVEGEKGVIEESKEGKGSEVKVEGDVSGEGKGLIEKSSEEGIVGRDQVIFPLDAEEAAKLSKVLRDIINVLPTKGRYFSDYRKVLQQIVDRLESDSVLDLSVLPRGDIEKVAQFLLNHSDVTAFADMFRTGDFVHLDRIKSDYFKMIADRYVSYLARKLQREKKRGKVSEVDISGIGEEGVEGVKGEEMSESVSDKGPLGEEGGVGKGAGEIGEVSGEQRSFLGEGVKEEAGVGSEGGGGDTKLTSKRVKEVDFLEGVFDITNVEQENVVGKGKKGRGGKGNRGKGLEKDSLMEKGEVAGGEGGGQGLSIESILAALDEVGKGEVKERSKGRLGKGGGKRKEEVDIDFDIDLREVTVPQQMMRFINVPFVVDVINRDLVEFKGLFNDYKRLEEISGGRSAGEGGEKVEFLGEGNAQFLPGHISELLFKDDVEALRAVKAEMDRHSESDLRKYRPFMEEVIFPWLEERLSNLDAKGLLSFALGTSRTLRLRDNPIYQDLVDRISKFKGERPPIETGTQLNSFVTAYFLRLFHDSDLGYYKKLDSDFLSKLASLMHLWYADPMFFGYGKNVEVERLAAFKELLRDYKKGSKSIGDVLDDRNTLVNWVKNVFNDIAYYKQLLQLYREGKLVTKEEYDARLKVIEQLKKQAIDPNEVAKLEREERSILGLRESALSKEQLSLDAILIDSYNRHRQEFINFLQRGNFRFRDLVDKDILFDVYTFPERIIVNMHAIWKSLGGEKGVDAVQFKRRVYTYLVSELFGDLVPKEIWERYLVDRDVNLLALNVREALESGYLGKEKAEAAGKLFITFTRDVFKNFFNDFWVEFQKGEATTDRFIELLSASFVKNFVLRFGKDSGEWFYPTKYLELLQDYFKQTVLYIREEMKLVKDTDILRKAEFLQRSLYDINNQRLDVTLKEFTEVASRVFYGEGPEILEKVKFTLQSKENEAKQILNELGVGLVDENGRINIERVDNLFIDLFKLKDSPLLERATELIRNVDYDVVYFGDNRLTFVKHLPGGKSKSFMYRLDGVLGLEDKFILQLYSVMRRYLRRLDEVGDELSKNRFLWNVLPSVFPVNVTVGKARRPLNLLLLEVRLPEYRNIDSFLDFFKSIPLNDILLRVQEETGVLLSKSRLNESVKEALRNLTGEKVILVLDINKYRDYLSGKIKRVEDIFVSVKDLLDIGKKGIGVEEGIQSKGRLVELVLRALFKESGIAKEDVFRLDKGVIDDVAFKAFTYKFLLREDINKVFSDVTSRDYLANIVRVDNYVFNRLAKLALEGGFRDVLSWLRLEVENANLPNVTDRLTKILQEWVGLGEEKGGKGEKGPLDEIDDPLGRSLRFERGNLAELMGRIGDIYPSVYMDPIFLYRFIQDTIARVVGEKVYVHIGDRATADVVNRVLFGRDDIFGAYMRLRGKDESHIFLALTDQLEFIKTFGHEVWHAVWKTLGDKEKTYLLDRYKSIEAVADAFGDYVVGKVLATEREKSIFEKVKEIIGKILNFFRGYGFTDVETIFSKVWLGRYSRGEVKPEEIPIGFYENMRYWVNRYGDVEQKLQFDEYYFRSFQKAQGYIQDQLNKMNSFIKNAVGKGGIDEVRALYEKGKGEDVSFWRKAFRYPVFDKVLSRVRELYNRAERNVNEEIVIDAENFFRRYGLYDENVKELFRKLAYDFGVRGGFPFNVGDVLRKQGIVDIEVQKRVAELLAEWKRITDKIYLEEKNHVLMLSFAMVKRKLADLYMKGQVTNPNAITELNKRLNNFIDAVLKSSEFEVVYDKRENIERELFQLGFDPLQVLEVTIHSLNPLDRIVALLPKKLNEQAIKDLRSFTETQSGLGDIFNMLTPQGMKELLPVLDSFNSVVDGLIGEASALKTTYYIPLVRNGGKYNVTVFAKDKNGKFHPIFYYETDKYNSDYSQRNELFDVVRGLRDEYQNQGLRGDQYDLLILDRWDGNGPLSEFVMKNLSSPNVERVIVYGRKKEGSNTFHSLSPGEQLIFINELVNRYVAGGADSIGQTLQDALSRYWASQSYARARAMARRQIPDEFGSVIEGFKKDFDDVSKEYIYRMVGHLKNNRFSFYFNEWLRSQEGQEVMGNPDLRNFVERYYKSLVTPASSFARVVYGIRMFASLYYLGLRVSTGLLNFVNTLTYAWPLMTDRLIEKYRDLGQDIGYVRSSVDTGKYILKGFNLLGDLQSRGYLDRFFYLKPELLSQIKELYDVPVDQWVLRIDGKDIIPSERDVLYLKGLYELFLGKVVESSFLRELRQDEMLKFGRVVSKAFDTVFWFFSNTERLARTVTALSYLDLVYDVNRKFGIPTREVPITELRELIDKAFFDYTRSNRPYWANPSTSLGAIASVPLTLKGFVMNSMNLFAEMLGQKQYKSLAHSLALFFILGGLAGIPFIDDILDVLERVTKEPLRLNIRNFIKRKIGDTPADFIVKGLPYISGLDFSSSIKVELPFPKGFSNDELGKWLFGVYENIIERGNRGFKSLLAGNYLEAVTYLMPYGMSLPLEAYMLSTEGLMTKGKRRILIDGQEFYLDNVDTFLRILGFRPKSLAEVQDYRYMVERVKNWYRTEKQDLLKKYRIAVESGSGVDDVLRDIMEFNEEIIRKGYYDLVPVVTSRTLKQALRPEEFSLERAISF